jgi:hypothetical protein
MEIVEPIDAAVSFNNKTHSTHSVLPTLADVKTDIHVHHTNNLLSNWYYTGTQETMQALRDWWLI